MESNVLDQLRTQSPANSDTETTWQLMSTHSKPHRMRIHFASIQPLAQSAQAQLFTILLGASHRIGYQGLHHNPSAKRRSDHSQNLRRSAILRSHRSFYTCEYGRGGLWLAEPIRGGTTKYRKGRRDQPNRK